MKTIIESISVSTALYTVIFILIASVAFGSVSTTNPPTVSGTTSTGIEFADEAYIDDIPFDTEAIAENYKLEKSLNVVFDFEDEAYVDDIPFDTFPIAKNAVDEKNLKNTFYFEEETYVDDIPFNTEKIASEVFFIYYSKK